MNNVGEIKTFLLNGNTPTQPMRYVWKWWDGSVDVTTSGTVSKQLNTGGNPADGYQVRYTCEAVSENGQSAEYAGELVVNNPPSLVLGSTSLSNNGGDFSFRTKASLVAYDMENEAVGFEWFSGGQSLGGGNPSVYGSVNGTYAGTFAGTYEGVLNYIDHDVVENGSLTCNVYDLSGGTTAIQFYLFGQSPTQSYSAPQAVAYQATIDSASEPVVRIGAGEYAEFTVYTQENANPTSFIWSFHGSNGWAATTYSTGTTSPLENGAFKNQALKATLGEYEGQKYAECRITDVSTGVSAEVTIPIFLETNAGPTISSAQVAPTGPVVGDIMSFEVNASDADLDILTYKWYFPDFSTTLYGRRVFISSAGLSPGNTFSGIVTVTDRVGASVTQTVESAPLA
ncbi:MAG: hypothetical protein ACOYB3_01140 [Azonexus sp.]